MLTAEKSSDAQTARAGYSARGTSTPALIRVDSLVAGHQRLVRQIAWHVHSRMSTAIEIEDLMQIGLIALIEAAQNFDDRGVAFASYASTRVRGAMIDALRRDARICRSGMKNHRRIEAIRHALEQRLMRSPSEAEIAAEMGLDAASYQAMAANARAVRQESIEESYSDQDMGFADMADSAETALEKNQMQHLLASSIQRLPEKEQQVLQLYFIEEMNLEEIGLTLGVGAARICQIKKAALARLRGLMQN